MSNETVAIRSFRLAFEVERRIHKIDRWRVPLPYGLPLRSLGYAIVALVVVLIASGLPLVGVVLGGLPWPVRYLVLPGVTAQLLTQVQVDGRPAHEFLVAWLRLRVEGRRTIAFGSSRACARELLDAVTVAPDERHVDYRRGTVVGAGAVLLRRAAELQPRGRRLLVSPEADEPAFVAKRVALKPGQRVVIA